MAGKTLINGTEYTISGGKALVNGTGYSVSGGKTLVGGTGYDISFKKGINNFIFSVGVGDTNIYYFDENNRIQTFTNTFYSNSNRVLAYGNGTLCTIWHNNEAQTSSSPNLLYTQYLDAVLSWNWTSVLDQGIVPYQSALMYGNNKFVVCCTDTDNQFHSGYFDGTTAVINPSITLPGDGQFLNGLVDGHGCYGGGRFVYLVPFANGSYVNYGVYISSDGATWVYKRLSNLNGNFNISVSNLIYVNNTFYFLSCKDGDGTTLLWTMPDTYFSFGYYPTDIPLASSRINSSLNNLGYMNNNFIFINSASYISSNLTNWTQTDTTAISNISFYGNQCVAIDGTQGVTCSFYRNSVNTGWSFASSHSNTATNGFIPSMIYATNN